MKSVHVGSTVAPNFDNEFVYLWHCIPDKIFSNELIDTEKTCPLVCSILGPTWKRGSFATVVQVLGPWTRVLVQEGSGWILEHNLVEV